jgi:hypothetical protein
MDSSAARVMVKEADRPDVPTSEKEKAAGDVPTAEEEKAAGDVPKVFFLMEILVFTQQ